MKTNSAASYGVMGGLYGAQGVLYGFATLVLLPMLAAKGVSLQAQTGLLALAGLPWIFKLVWALLLDRMPRVSTRLVAGLATAVLAAIAWALSSVDDPTGNVGTIGALWFLLNVVLSLQDVSTDAFILDVIPDERRGLANGIVLGALHLGNEGVAGMFLASAVATRGLSWGLGVVAAVVAVCSVPALLPLGVGNRRRNPLSVQGLWSALGTRASLIACLLAVLAFFADALTSAVSADFLINHLRWTPADIGQVLAPVLLVSSVGGYLLASVLVDRLGHRVAAWIGSAALGATWLVFALGHGLWFTPGVLPAMVVLQSVATSLLYVGLYAWLMGRVGPTVRATHFAVFMALLNVPRSAAPPPRARSARRGGLPLVVRGRGALPARVRRSDRALRQVGDRQGEVVEVRVAGPRERAPALESHHQLRGLGVELERPGSRGLPRRLRSLQQHGRASRRLFEDADLIGVRAVGAGPGGECDGETVGVDRVGGQRGEVDDLRQLRHVLETPDMAKARVPGARVVGRRGPRMRGGPSGHIFFGSGVDEDIRHRPSAGCDESRRHVALILVGSEGDSQLGLNIAQTSGAESDDHGALLAPGQVRPAVASGARESARERKSPASGPDSRSLIAVAPPSLRTTTSRVASPVDRDHSEVDRIFRDDHVGRGRPAGLRVPRLGPR